MQNVCFCVRQNNMGRNSILWVTIWSVTIKDYLTSGGFLNKKNHSVFSVSKGEQAGLVMSNQGVRILTGDNYSVEPPFFYAPEDYRPQRTVSCGQVLQRAHRLTWVSIPVSLIKFIMLWRPFQNLCTEWRAWDLFVNSYQQHANVERKGYIFDQATLNDW